MKQSRRKLEMFDKRDVGLLGQPLNYHINQARDALLLRAGSIWKVQWNKTVRK
jgi:hypothetical protein